MPRNVNKEHKQSFTALDKIALFITKKVGTMWCAILFSILALISLPEALEEGTASTANWLTQTFLQLVLLSIIMVGQNLQRRHSKLRAEADYETNLEEKRDIEILAQRLDTIEKEKLDKILKILEEKQ
jgi:uncharacterized membrane protein